MFSLRSIFGDPAQKVMAQSHGMVEAVNAFAPAYETLSDEALR